MENIIYLDHDFDKGWPSGGDLYYRCAQCGDFVPSTRDGHCTCGNIYVDTGYGRAGAKDQSKISLVRKLS